MVHWIVKKYNNGDMIYVSGLDENGNPVHTDKKEEAEKFYDLGIPMKLYFEHGYCIEKQY